MFIAYVYFNGHAIVKEAYLCFTNFKSITRIVIISIDKFTLEYDMYNTVVRINYKLILYLFFFIKIKECYMLVVFNNLSICEQLKTVTM